MKTVLMWTAVILLCSMGWLGTLVFLGLARMVIVTAFT